MPTPEAGEREVCAGGSWVPCNNLTAPSPSQANAQAPVTPHHGMAREVGWT